MYGVATFWKRLANTFYIALDKTLFAPKKYWAQLFKTNDVIS